jgi:hypothetical protein
MFQDHEGIPEGMVGESYVSESLWEWLDLDADDAAMWAAYREDEDIASYEQARDAYQGTYESEVAFAEQLFDDLGLPAGRQPARELRGLGCRRSRPPHGLQLREVRGHAVRVQAAVAAHLKGPARGHKAQPSSRGLSFVQQP